MKALPAAVSLVSGSLVLLTGQTQNPRGNLSVQRGSQRTLQFENKDVAVWRTVVPPNAPLVMHTHQHPRVVIALSGGNMNIVNEDGSSEVHVWETGKAYWLSHAEGLKRHADQNTGSKSIEVMVVELKNAQ